jgi:hypothetical protein
MPSVPLSTRRYTSDQAVEWDAFLDGAKNSTFLFARNYMDYHSDRFTDHSLMFFKKEKLIALLPACESGSQFISHEGLSFGGLIQSAGLGIEDTVLIFQTIREYLEEKKFTKLVYRAIPNIYHQGPADEDLYALFLLGAKLVGRHITYVIEPSKSRRVSKGRKWGLSKSRKASIEVDQSNDYATFMQIESDNLMQKYGIRPVHTTDEIELLASRFPQNIKLYAAYSSDREMIAGTVIYETEKVAHAQYIATTESGRDFGAFDAIMSVLLNDVYAEKEYFDFGRPTEGNGKTLNSGLARYKESFGARGITHDCYELDIGEENVTK